MCFPSFERRVNFFATSKSSDTQDDAPPPTLTYNIHGRMIYESWSCILQRKFSQHFSAVKATFFCGGSNSLGKRQTIKSWFGIHSDVRRGTNKNEVYISWVMTNVWFRFHNIFWIMFWTDYLLWMSEIQTLHRNTSVEICSAKMWNIKDPFLN